MTTTQLTWVPFRCEAAIRAMGGIQTARPVGWRVPSERAAEARSIIDRCWRTASIRSEGQQYALERGEQMHDAWPLASEPPQNCWDGYNVIWTDNASYEDLLEYQRILEIGWWHARRRWED